jgi:hypothetical protein
VAAHLSAHQNLAFALLDSGRPDTTIFIFNKTGVTHMKFWGVTLEQTSNGHLPDRPD